MALFWDFITTREFLAGAAAMMFLGSATVRLWRRGMRKLDRYLAEWEYQTGRRIEEE